MLTKNYKKIEYYKKPIKKVVNSNKKRIPWNKGLTKENDEKIRKISKKMSIAQIKRFQNPAERKKNSEAQKIAQNRPDIKVKSSGINHYAWKIYPNPGNVHGWLKAIYGKAYFCENKKNNVLDFKCSNISVHFDWALKKNCAYERNRDSFYMLCRGCHHKYDDKGQYGFKKGHTPWNKNLTKYIDVRVKKYGIKSGNSRKNKGYIPKTAWKKGAIPWCKGRTKETDERLKKAGEKKLKAKQHKK